MGPYVCILCRRIMVLETVGVVAIELVSKEGKPYKAYRFDKFKCPECGYEALLQHGEPVGNYCDDFENWLKEATLFFY